MKYWQLNIILVLALIGCRKKVDWELEKSDETIYSIDALFTNEDKYQSLTITTTNIDPNQIQSGVADALVMLTNYNDTIFFFPDIDSVGLYVSEFEFPADDTGEYVLDLFIDTHYFKAVSYAADVAGFQRMNYFQITDTSILNNSLSDTLYTYQRIAPNYTPYGEQAMFYTYFDWSHLPEYANESYENTHAFSKEYTLNTYDISQEDVTNLPKRFTFPKGTRITQQKYSVNEEHAAFLRTLMAETEWHGGTFDIAKNNLYTNFDGGAVGFFAVCKVREISFVVE